MHVASTVAGNNSGAQPHSMTINRCSAMDVCLALDIALDAVGVECHHPVLGWISRNQARRPESYISVSIVVLASGDWSTAQLG